MLEIANYSVAAGRANLKWNGYFNNSSRSDSLQKFAELHGMPSLNMTLEEAKKVEILIPLFFFQNGVFMAEDPLIDTKILVDRYIDEQIYKSKSGCGIYSFDQDTINVLKYRYMQNRFTLPRWENKLVKYQGIIANDSTIINWRQVPP